MRSNRYTGLEDGCVQWTDGVLWSDAAHLLRTYYKMKVFISVAVAVTLLAAVVVAVMPVQAAPFYTTKTKNMIFLKIQPVDPNGKSNNCYHEIYARATPKNNNHVLLNKETIVNSNPNNGPSKIYFLKWYYNVAVFHRSDATNEGKIRTYAYLELGTDHNSPTVTKYIPLDRSKEVTVGGQTVLVLDFQTFKLVTDPRRCS
jgi:hypothetical protein